MVEYTFTGVYRYSISVDNRFDNPIDNIIEYPDCTSTNSATIDSRMKLLAMKKLRDKRDTPVASSVLVKAHEIPRVVEEDDERIADYM